MFLLTSISTTESHILESIRLVSYYFGFYLSEGATSSFVAVAYAINLRSCICMPTSEIF